MKLFGLEIKKIDAENKWRTYRGQTFSMTGDMPKSTFDLFYKHYRKSSDIRRCVVELQETVGAGGYCFVDKEWNVVENLETTTFDEALNSHQSFGDFKRRFIRDLSISGNVFLNKLRPAFGKNGKPVGFQFLDPRTMAIVADEYGDVIKYIQHVRASSDTIERENMLHFIDEPDPDNEIFGLSLMEGLIIDVLADTEAWESNYYFFKNNAVPWQLIILDENMKGEEMDFAIEQLKKNFSWGKNSHKVSAVTWVKDIKKVQDSLNDMQFIEMRWFTTNKVCAAFGVPKVILNYTDWVNYSNAETQYTKFMENTIRPRERRLEQFVNMLMLEYTDKYKFQIIDDHIDQHVEKTDVLVKQINSGIITINEARQELSLDPYEGIDEADMPLITRWLTRLEDAGLDEVSINPFEA